MLATTGSAMIAPTQSPIQSPPLDLNQPRPVLLLDIDGVINVFQCRTARATQVAPYLPTLHMLPNLHANLQRLDAAFNLVWCSSWGSLVNVDAAAAWGLAPRPWIAPTPDEAAQQHWKALAVARTLANWPGSVVWVEDGFPPQTRKWAISRIAQGHRTWLLDVRETGLTDQVTDDLIAWTEL